MKYLSHYTEEKHTKLFKEFSCFFAFNMKQFEKSRIPGVKYTQLRSGLFIPKHFAKIVILRMNQIYEEAIKEDLAENGKDKIIERELNNYECFYSFDLDIPIEILKDYGITPEEVQTKFNELKQSYHYDY